MTQITNNNLSSMQVTRDVLDKLKNMDVIHHWLRTKTNNDKLEALILFYEENYKK